MPQADIESVLQEKRVFPPPPAFKAGHIANAAAYARWARLAEENPEAFWSEIARELEWFSPWQSVLEWKAPFAKWFVGATTNLAHNCLDRHLTGWRRNKAAIIWEGEPGDSRILTYHDLHREVSQVRQRPQAPRRRQGRPRRHLPADDSGSGDRHAGLRPHRRHPQRRLRRLQRRGAARPLERRASQAAGHRRRRLPPRHGRAAQDQRRRGAARRAVGRERGGRAPHRRNGGHEGRPRPLVARR